MFFFVFFSLSLLFIVLGILSISNFKWIVSSILYLIRLNWIFLGLLQISSVGTLVPRPSRLSFHPENQMQLDLQMQMPLIRISSNSARGFFFYFQITLDDERKERQGLLSFIAERGYKCHLIILRHQSWWHRSKSKKKRDPYFCCLDIKKTKKQKTVLVFFLWVLGEMNEIDPNAGSYLELFHSTFGDVHIDIIR